MTGDVEEEYALLQISNQIEDQVPLDSCIPVTQADTNSFINSNMTIEDACTYTAAIPAEIAANYPEGAVLQMLQNATLVTLPIKCLPSSKSNAVILKEPPFTEESTTTQSELNSILTTSTENNGPVSTDVTEGNMSDIDLSFLNEAVVNKEISISLNESAVKELQGIISEVTQESLNVLQNNLDLTNDVEKQNVELEQPNQETPPKDGEDLSSDLVMIDVSKPIQLAQNSLIVINGQKCVLQQDPQSGHVIAYPVKEQDKPKKKRGRPRKTSVEQQVSTEATVPENVSSQEMESMSEDDTEKGLLEIVNDDGSLVRRSSRKRKKNKVLKDYETGNLQQELGSDVDDLDLFDHEDELHPRKRKQKGPGRPRKYPRPFLWNEMLSENAANGEKRQRGRPKKSVSIPADEPAQAFLVQTADGQTLMMQVPLSSIPANMTLQDMAEQIASNLNASLSQAKTAESNSIKGIVSQNIGPSSIENVNDIAASSTNNEAISRNVVQDHSVGSTTNFSSIQPNLSSADENSHGMVDSSCQDIIQNIDDIIIDTVEEVEEVILESESSSKDVVSCLQNFEFAIPDNISNSQINSNVPPYSQDFCIDVSTASSSSINCTSILNALSKNLTDQFCVSNPNEETVSEHFEETKESTSSEGPNNLLKNDVLKNKVDFQLLMENNGIERPDEDHNVQIDELLTNVNTSDISNDPNFEDSPDKRNITLSSELIGNVENCVDKEFLLNQIASFHCYGSSASKTNTSECFDAEISNEIDNFQNDATLEKIGESIQNNSLEIAADNKLSDTVKSDINPNTQILGTLLSLPRLSSTTATSTSEVDATSISCTAVTPVSKSSYPFILPANGGDKKCKICKLSFATDDEIIQHFKAKHPKCICTECDYTADHPYIIKRHFYRHANHPSVCKICNKSYKDLYILKMHVKMVHLPPEVLYTCDICEKQFTRKAHLKRHLRIHEPVKQFKCPHCNYQGCEKSDITKHLLIHEEPKFSCDTCGKQFRHMKNRDLHMKRHSGQRDYKCGVCDFYGYTFTDIRKHIERRHKNAACDTCGNVFFNVDSLKDHKKSGLCVPNEAAQVKVEEIVSEDSSEAHLLDEIPLELLETEQVTIQECSEETISSLQSGQHLIMAPVDSLVDNQVGQLVIESAEEGDSVLLPENFSVITIDNDSKNPSNKAITLMTSDGKNISLSLKNSSIEYLPPTNQTDQTPSTKFVITNETEPTS